ncbi:Archaemetzincin-2 [Seminavis robusta]|uniref:Archaemetzincin-2 n=1 Tax=Seminavis robusta TaxID=568900 RepID=A0A9N8HJ72_9STRA|nr:Archaemetzincin-2 [Seminavis robusta]|eukprot:Sro641_g179990.1 Archaemetzincin-2 (318) ;mRNA; r:20319-21272
MQHQTPSPFSQQLNLSVDEIMKPKNQARSSKLRRDLIETTKTLAPLGIKLEPPRDGDWLAEHDEKGQTFLRYLTSDPVAATPSRNKIYIVPLGDFTDEQHELVRRVSEFMAAFYGLPVVVQDVVGLESVNKNKQRVHPEWGDKQILSTFILDKLTKYLPPDAATYLCFTSSDLWPRDGWNFVFGQASLVNRVGVWSFYRHGSKFSKCLKRTLSTAVHETGHIFGMRHCTAYSCGMCGSNSLPESDRRPIHFCPECTPKVSWATGVDLVERAKNLAALCEEWGLNQEAEYYARSVELLSSAKPDYSWEHHREHQQKFQ